MSAKLNKLIRSLRSQDHRWRVYIFFGVLVYFIAINQVIRVRPDHIFIALVVLSFALGKQRARRFLIDWLPFILFWVLYDMMRGVADSVRGHIAIAGPYRLEQMLFEPILHGDVPAFLLQAARESWYPLLRRIVSLLAANFYTVHFAAPLLLGWVLWHTTDDRPMFYKFVYTLTLLNLMALATFVLLPSAPPWYVYKYGFFQPDPEARFWEISAGNLLDVDRLFGMHFFTTLWGAFNSNHFAAIPSLHGAYPIVVSLFAYKKFRKHLFWFVLYPVATWFSAVYLNHHYVVDLLIGALYIVIAYVLSVHVLYRKIFSRFLGQKREDSLGVV